MKVLHVIPSLSPSSGGPSFALPAMARALAARGVTISVATTDDDGPGRRLKDVDAGVEVSQPEGWSIRYFPKQTEFYKVSLPMQRWLREHVREYHVVHVHAVFSFASLVAGRAAAAAGVPYIVRPLGVLNRWGMENRRKLVKYLSFRMLDLPMLRRAAAMHYTSTMELKEASRFALTNRQVVIPLGIDVSPFVHLPVRDEFSRRHPETASSRNILFLSRVDQKKGIDLLLPAFATVHRAQADLRLVICGEGDPALILALKQQAAALGIADAVTWAGHVDREGRLAAFAAAEMFVLPSRSENFGIALLEAMAAGLPCVASDRVALAVDAAAASAVRVVPLETEALAAAMQTVLESAEERRNLGRSARELAERDYSLGAMGGKLHDLYREVTSHAT